MESSKRKKILHASFLLWRELASSFWVNLHGSSATFWGDATQRPLADALAPQWSAAVQIEPSLPQIAFSEEAALFSRLRLSRGWTSHYELIWRPQGLTKGYDILSPSLVAWEERYGKANQCWERGARPRPDTKFFKEAPVSILISPSALWVIMSIIKTIGEGLDLVVTG